MIIPDNTEQNEKLNGIRNYHLPCLNEFFIIQIIRTQRERVHHHHHFGYKFPIEIFLAAWFRVQQSSNDSLWIWFFKCNSNAIIIQSDKIQEVLFFHAFFSLQIDLQRYEFQVDFFFNKNLKKNPIDWWSINFCKISGFRSEKNEQQQINLKLILYLINEKY